MGWDEVTKDKIYWVYILAGTIGGTLYIGVTKVDSGEDPVGDRDSGGSRIRQVQRSKESVPNDQVGVHV
jgi:hypothetical protein